MVRSQGGTCNDKLLKGKTMYLISIKTGNAAFVDNERAEVARILHKLAGNIEGTASPTFSGHVGLRDMNGNTIGVCTTLKDSAEVQINAMLDEAHKLHKKG